MKVVKATSAKLQGARTYARAREAPPTSLAQITTDGARTYARAREARIDFLT